MRVLVADDEPALRESLARSLRFEGYTVATAGDGLAALAAVEQCRPDALVLDVVMPRLDGIEACRRLRAAGDHTPILVLTARDAVRDRVRGLNVGADDYLCKPFALEELLARLRSIVRRSGVPGVEPPMTVGDLQLDPATWTVARAGRELSLTRTEFQLLEMLVRHPGQVLTRRQLDWAVLMGYDVAADVLEHTGEPSTLYVRADPDYVAEVRDVLPAQVNPERPDQVAVSRPSDALAAQAATEEAFTGLLLGLGAVSLLVGGVGVANVMVMGVLERRGEIGLRRALGAARAHVRRQFLGESVVLAGIGGLAGVVLGALVTAGYAMSRDLPTVVPVEAIVGGIGVALVLGALAGLYPAIRAARLSPLEALRTT